MREEIKENRFSGLRGVTLIGMGPGSPALVTEKAVQALRGADALFGAQRLLRTAEQVLEPGVSAEKQTFGVYRPEDVCAVLSKHPEIRYAAVLFSGSLSLCSGAALWRDVPGLPCRIARVPGISSADYFLSQIGRSLQEVEIVPAHGTAARISGLILHRPAVLVLLGGNDTFSRTLRELHTASAGDVRVTLAEFLSYPEERITEGTADAFLERGTEPGRLAMALFENAAPRPEVPGFWIADSRFLRDSAAPHVPMTKEEVRALSLSLLGLRRDSILYDIGAGTGSVSIAAAEFLTRGQVIAFERNPDAVQLLRENRRKFHAANLEIVPGEFPASLREEIPAPDAAFVGGTGGRMTECLRALLRRNPGISAVINSVTLETAAEIAALKDLFPAEKGWQISVRVVQVSRFEAAGPYHLARPQSPVMIAAVRKKADGAGTAAAGIAKAGTMAAGTAAAGAKTPAGRTGEAGHSGTRRED